MHICVSISVDCGVALSKQCDSWFDYLNPRSSFFLIGDSKVSPLNASLLSLLINLY